MGPSKQSQRRRGARRVQNSGSEALFSLSGLRPGINDRRYTQTQTAIVPFPWKYHAHLTYGMNISLGTVGSVPTASQNRFRLNSMYDFDATGTGEQPYQYDQMVTTYLKYIVHSTRIELTFVDPTSDGLWVGYSLHTDGTNNDQATGKTLGDVMSRPGFRCMPLNNTGEQVVTIKETIPIHSVFGLTKAQYDALWDTFGAAYNANPLSNAYLDVFIIDPNSLVSPQYVRCVGRAIFDCTFFDYAGPAGS